MAIQQTAAVPKKPLIGLNYPVPWNAYGVYFGGGNPPASFPPLDAWTVNLKQNLIQLRDTLGIRVVRIFLMGNAVNYGTVARGGTVSGSGFPPVVGFPTPVFTPPAALHPKFVDHLQKMFLAFRDTSCLVIPSLIDFKAFGANVLLSPAVAAAPPIVFEGSVIIQGTKAKPAVDNGCFDRQAIVQDSAVRDAFFRQTLEAFLTASIPFKTSIYAWEVQNEPYWNIQSFANTFVPLRIAGGPTVTESESSVFLQQGIDLIHKHGFQSTVGHRFLDDLDNLPTGSRRQFHYYPRDIAGALGFSDSRLPKFDETKAFLGEFGIQAPSDDHGDLWPDLNGADAGTTDTRVLARLNFIRAQGYPLALIWPDGLDEHSKSSPAPGLDPIQLSPLAQKGIQAFMASS